MKLEFLTSVAGFWRPTLSQCRVESEVHRLTDVLLCRPSYLAPVPCCSVTQESLRNGFKVSVTEAVAQHEALQAALERQGVRCHLLPPDEALPDMCFTRDAMVTTPWGVMALRPAALHRQAEAEHALRFVRELGTTPAATLGYGTAEGGDVAVVRPGLVIVGQSGERTDEAGANAVAAIFRARGWDALIYRFDPHFLHLDTQFSMVGKNLALACTDVLDDRFIQQLGVYGIELIPVKYKEARQLGCNVLAIGNGVILSTVANGRVNVVLRERGFTVEELDLDQFTHCGGGVHCLTMPLARRP
jgi:N-dimethylarginine dimethylaminohydrolase